jgi:hypothetical protein
LGISGRLFSQTPTELWQSVEYVKNISNKGPRIMCDGLGNVYMITTQIDENPFLGFTLVKYDSLGNQLWQRNHPIEIFGHIYGDFIVDSLGYAYVSLLFSGAIPDYDADTKLLKYDPNGEKLWENANYRDAHTGDNYIYFMGRDSVGRLFVLGRNDSQESVADNFLFVSEIDTSDGSELWRSTFPGVHWLQGIRVWEEDQIEVLTTRYAGGIQHYDIIQLNKQGETIQYSSKPYTGYTLDFNLISRTGDVITGNRGFGYAVTRLNAAADTLWRYALIEGIPGDRVLGITEDDSLNVYVTGGWKDSTYNRDILTTKFSQNGELLWQKNYDYLGDELDNGGIGIAVDGKWVYVIGYSTNGPDKYLLTILIYDIQNGEERYVINIERGLVFSGQEISPYGNKFFYTGVSHMNTPTSSEIVTGCFKMPEIVSTSWQPGTGQQVEVFPNPFAQELYLCNIDLQVFKSVELFDMQGRLLMSKTLRDEQEHLVLEGQEYKGALTLVLRGKGVTLSKKIIGH